MNLVLGVLALTSSAYKHDRDWRVTTTSPIPSPRGTPEPTGGCWVLRQASFINCYVSNSRIITAGLQIKLWRVLFSPPLAHPRCGPFKNIEYFKFSITECCTAFRPQECRTHYCDRPVSSRSDTVCWIILTKYEAVGFWWIMKSRPFFTKLTVLIVDATYAFHFTVKKQKTIIKNLKKLWSLIKLRQQVLGLKSTG